jgi:CHAD domain-containing protein
MEDQMEKPRKRVEKFLDSLSPIRDVQVQLLAANDLVAAYPDLRRFQKRMLKRERSLTDGMTSKVDAHRRKLKKVFNAALADSRSALDSATPVDIRRTMVDRVNNAFSTVLDAIRDIDPEQVATIHRMRVAFKRFRYMVQAAKPTLRDMQDTTLERMHSLQTLLGSVHDADVLLEALKKWGRKQPKKERRALEPVYEMLAESRGAAVAEALKRLDEVPTFWQMREKKLNPALVRSGG